MAKSFQHKLSRFSTKEELQQLRDALDDCVSAADILELREEVLPKVAGMEERCDKMSADNEDMRECIGAFDRALCEKANKTGLHSLEACIRAEFVRTSDWRTMSTVLDANDRERTAVIEEIKRENDAVQQNLLNTVGEIATNITNEKLASYEKVAQGFQKFFNAEELSR